jgi:hypothetical protein
MSEKVNMAEANLKVCPGCRRSRSLGDFPHPDRPWADFCKDCLEGVKKRKNVVSKKWGDLYGVPHNFGVPDFLALLVAQNGRCAICKCWPAHPLKDLHLDHCHTKEYVRGLLCISCNTGIGNFKHDPDRLRAAAAYLEAVAARLEKAEAERREMLS